MYRERSSHDFDVASPLQGRAPPRADTLRDYLRSERFKTVRATPPARPAPSPAKRHVLVLHRGVQGKSSQRFEFDAEGFDVSFAPWRPGEPLAAPAVPAGLPVSLPISLIVVDFQEGAYADTAVYPLLKGALPGVPIIILATSEGPIDRIVALELGADDFMSKPAHPRELQARARAILKSMPDYGVTPAASRMSYGGIHLDLVDRAATTDRGRAKLCGVEFWLLRSLMEAEGRPITRESLVERIEAETGDPGRDTRAIDVIVSRLRKKIDMPGRESLIRTVRRQGYCI